MLVGMISVAAVATFTDISFLYYNVVGAVVVLVVGVSISGRKTDPIAS